MFLYKADFSDKETVGDHRESTLDILPKEWSETAKNSRRYDCLVSSPAREGAKFTGGVGAGGRKRDGEWGREEIGEVKKD